MSVKQSLLVLLAQQPMYGAQLRTEFEERTGGTWPLNIGQVYTTLSRLERDGLVQTDGEPDDDGRILYAITDDGRAEQARWLTSPVTKASDPRDELTIKLALSVGLPGVDVRHIIQAQRAATLKHLQELTRLKRQADESDDLAWELVVERMIFAAESQVRWLDHVESRLTRKRDPRAVRPLASRAEQAVPQ
jgi:DNA-binding PadR family transcriptional regulator